MRAVSAALRKQSGKLQQAKRVSAKISPIITRTKSRIKTKSKSSVKGKLVQFPLARLPKKKIKSLSPAARDQMVLDTRDQARKIARSILRKWRSRLELEEVDSIVDLSLCEAVIRFDPNRGASFVTFLYYHLRGNLIRLVSDAANQNTLPLFDREMMEGTSDLSSANPIANAIEVAAALNGQEQVLPDEEFYKKELASLSRSACKKLDLLEQEVICRVFMNEEHLFDVAENLGYSRCHISRVKRKALDTLHSELKPLIQKALTEIPVRVGVRRRPISRRGQQRREILQSVHNRSGALTNEDFRIAL